MHRDAGHGRGSPFRMGSDRIGILSGGTEVNHGESAARGGWGRGGGFDFMQLNHMMRVRPLKRTVDRMDSKSILGRAVHRCSSASSISAAVYVFNLCAVGAAAATAEPTTPFILLPRSSILSVGGGVIAGKRGR